MSTIADFAAAFGRNYPANQSSFDVADNGVVEPGSADAPDWLYSLNRVVGTGAGIYNAVTGKTPTKIETQPAKPPPAAAPPAPQSGSGKWWILGAIAAAVVGLVLFLKK